MAYEMKIIRRVAFSETDLAGIVHFSNYFRYMEAAEHELFRSIGYSIVTRIEGRRFGWPRVACQCRFSRPLRFEDELEVHLLIRRISRRSISYDFIFRKLTEGGGRQEVGRGRMTTVCVSHEEVAAGDGGAGRMSAVEIPAPIAARLEPAPRSVLNSQSEGK